MTECLGGSMELSEEELGLRYQVRLLASFSEPSLSPPSLAVLEFL